MELEWLESLRFWIYMREQFARVHALTRDPRGGTGGKWFVGCFTAALVVLSGGGEGATLDHLRQDNAIRIAYRLDAPSFSYQDAAAKPAGLIVDLCQAVAKRLSQQLKLPSLKANYFACHRRRPV